MRKVRQITIETTPPRWVLIIERTDGTFNVLEDEEKVLRAYRPKRDESTSLHRALVR